MVVKIDLPESGGETDAPSSLDEVNKLYKNIVSRHRKFTAEFERTLVICVDQFKNLAQKGSYKEHLVKCFNSIYNNSVTAEHIESLKQNYVECEHCSGVLHCQVVGTSKPPLRPSEARPSDIERMNSEKDRKKRLRNFINYATETRSSLPDIFVQPAQNIINRLRERQQLQRGVSKADFIEVDTGSSLSEYIIYTVKCKTDEHSALKAFVDLMSDGILYLHNNVFPLVKIFSVSIIVTVLQWILFIARVIYDSRHPEMGEVEGSVMFGAFSGTLLKEEIAIYRIFTSTFFHNSAAHLVIGTIMHFRFSSVFERIHGASTTLVIYFLTSAYGMVGICWYLPTALQANGIAGDWGVAGALLSRYFIFPYLIDRERQHIMNSFVSLVCLLFVKTIKSKSSILISTHLLSALAGFCLGAMINNRLGKRRCCGIPNVVVDLTCSFTLLSVPIASVFALFLIKHVEGV